jgi:hypothetical protein
LAHSSGEGEGEKAGEAACPFIISPFP